MVKSTYPECAWKKDEENFVILMWAGNFPTNKVLAAGLPRRSLSLVDMFAVNCMQLKVLPKNENKNYLKRHDILQKNSNLKHNKT